MDTISIWFSGHDHSAPAGGQENFGIWASFCEGKTVFERHEKVNFSSATHPMTLLANAVCTSYIIVLICTLQAKICGNTWICQGKTLYKSLHLARRRRRKIWAFLRSKKSTPPMEAGVGGSLRILDTIRGNDQLTSIGDPLCFRRAGHKRM